MTDYLRVTGFLCPSNIKVMDTQPIKGNTAFHTTAPVSDKFEFNKKLNAEFLQNSYGANLEFGKKMFKIFLSTIEEDIEFLTRSLESNDYQAMQDIAHKIKNNFTWVGLPTMSSVMYKIENAAKEKSVTITTYYDELMDMFHNDHSLVQKEYDRLNSYLS